MKKRILLVGENQTLWDDFRNYLSNSGEDWEAEFLRTGPEALARVGQTDFDAVVVDVQLSGMNGVELLDEIMNRDSRAVRIILSDISDAQNTVKCVGRAHHHVLKPCDAVTVLTAVNQALALDAWMPSDAVRKLITRMRWVPSPPTSYARILTEMQSADASVEKIGELIAEDPALAAKVLQLANSATFGLQLQVVQPTDAVTYIGLEATRALVLLGHTFSSFDQLHVVGFTAESLWRHSLHTGHLARRIARLENADLELTELGFAAGLLHDIGKLLFAANLAEPFGQAMALARARHCTLWEAENQVFGASHSEVGASLLGIWGLPMPIVEAVGLHHSPDRSTAQDFSPLTAVHVANVLEHCAAHPEGAASLPTEFDLLYLKRLGVEQRMEERRRNCLSQHEAFAA